MFSLKSDFAVDRSSLDLSIIIVSWNVREYLAACLESIRTNAGSLTLEVIVVDSASTDDTLAVLRDHYPWVTVLAQTENVGFTRGNNIGLAQARGRYLLLLNPDTEILDTALGQMVAHLDARPDVGILGPHTLNSDGSHQSTRRRFPTLLTALFESTWLQPVAPTALLDRFYVRDVADDAVAAVDWVQGSALLTRRAIYDQLGGLDERFVMFSEELEWCRRIRDAGWQAVYLGTARIVHHGGKSTAQVPAFKHIYFQQSKLRYFARHHGFLVAGILRTFLIASYAAQIVVETGKGLLGHKRALRQQRVALYATVIRALADPSFIPQLGSN